MARLADAVHSSHRAVYAGTGPERRVPNLQGGVRGRETAPNRRGAELAGLVPGEGGLSATDLVTGDGAASCAVLVVAGDLGAAADDPAVGRAPPRGPHPDRPRLAGLDPGARRRRGPAAGDPRRDRGHLCQLTTTAAAVRTRLSAGRRRPIRGAGAGRSAASLRQRSPGPPDARPMSSTRLAATVPELDGLQPGRAAAVRRLPGRRGQGGRVRTAFMSSGARE